jgi:hypothetical protein
MLGNRQAIANQNGAWQAAATANLGQMRAIAASLQEISKPGYLYVTLATLLARRDQIHGELWSGSSRRQEGQRRELSLLIGSIAV